MTRAVQRQDADRGPLLTVAQVGEYLGTGERFVRRLITERRIDYVGPLLPRRRAPLPARRGRPRRRHRPPLDAMLGAINEARDSDKRSE
jgi:hypothetical protein